MVTLSNMVCLVIHRNVMHRFRVQAFQDPPLCSSTVFLLYTAPQKLIAQRANCSKCTLFLIERSLWAMCELFFLTIRSSLYTHFLSLRKSKITHRFWALAQNIRAMCPALVLLVSSSKLLKRKKREKYFRCLNEKSFIVFYVFFCVLYKGGRLVW